MDDKELREELVEKCMPTLERFEEIEKQVFYPIPKPAEFSATIRIYASTMSREAVRKALALLPNIEEAIKQERERILKLLPEIPIRRKHNQTCFDCVERIRRQALKKGESNG